MALDQFRHLGAQPLVTIDKIADSAPEPFAPNLRTPPDGVRALGLGHPSPTPDWAESTLEV